MKNINTINPINKINAENVTVNQTVNIVTENTTLRELLEMIGDVCRAEKRPTAKALREKKHEDGTVEQIQPIAETADGDCKVYANGYAVYSNNTGTTVLWLADCCSFTYQFDDLKENEKNYMAQRSIVNEDVLGSQPWFMAVMLRGDHQVERNTMDRKGDRRSDLMIQPQDIPIQYAVYRNRVIGKAVNLLCCDFSVLKHSQHCAPARRAKVKSQYPFQPYSVLSSATLLSSD